MQSASSNLCTDAVPLDVRDAGHCAAAATLDNSERIRRRQHKRHQIVTSRLHVHCHSSRCRNRRQTMSQIASHLEPEVGAVCRASAPLQSSDDGEGRPSQHRRSRNLHEHLRACIDTTARHKSSQWHLRQHLQRRLCTSTCTWGTARAHFDGRKDLLHIDVAGQCVAGCVLSPHGARSCTQCTHCIHTFRSLTSSTTDRDRLRSGALDGAGGTSVQSTDATWLFSSPLTCDVDAPKESAIHRAEAAP